MRLELISGLAVAGGSNGVVGGQALDLEAEKLGQPASPSLSHVAPFAGHEKQAR